MEHKGKLSELNLTEEEIERFTKAFKDENFRKMLRDYADEISDPENRKKYEEEITILEKERGNNVQFIHPTPFQCIKTSVNGQNKCYVNICANDKIGKPSCKSGMSEDGKSGHHWSLPHSLHPERKELDPKGNKILIYDVIFHPDTLHMASTNSRFMDMVRGLALQSIQDGFNVCLDKKNIKTMNTKYKGNPQACVIRKPISGFKAKVSSDNPDPLAFPYPDNKAAISKKEELNSQRHSKDLASIQEPTEPHYTIKYRSFIDLQDFTCTRDLKQSSRPKEIILTIDLPLLKSVAAITLEVKKKSLLLESQDPAYKLELTLAYAIDEDRGAAKFNRQARQLIVTLPVRCPEEELQISSSPQDSVSDMQDSDDVFEKEVEQDGIKNCAEGRAVESPENTAAKETGDMCDREKEGTEVSQQHQDSTDLRLCEEHQSETKTEGHEGVSDEKDLIGNGTTHQVHAYVKKEEIYEIQDKEEEGLESKHLIKMEKEQSEKASEDLPGTSEPVTAAEKVGEDLLKSERDFENTSVPLVLLREVREDGSQCVISDHVTTAGFSFHNSLLFELD
ncbi:hypothetical protein NQD34_016349 [Periophthalmus magnuspinnatus]|nr:hypothetical protein NQD34_016349 [Periophthalmus magnuspinnatus]